MTNIEFVDGSASRSKAGIRTDYLILSIIEEYWQFIIKSVASGDDVRSQERRIRLPFGMVL